MSHKVKTDLKVYVCDNDDSYNPLEDFINWTKEYTAIGERAKMQMEVASTTAAQNWGEYDAATRMIVRNLDTAGYLNVQVYTTLMAGAIKIQIPPGDWIKITNWDPTELVTFTSASGVVSYLALVW